MNLLENRHKNLPKHLAIIMDGNGRWAKQQGYSELRTWERNKICKIIIKKRAKSDRKLNLYAFSTENWNRPKIEVDTLMKILIKSLKKNSQHSGKQHQIEHDR
jgi:undecaprenyl diphosphate synthase